MYFSYLSCSSISCEEADMLVWSVEMPNKLVANRVPKEIIMMDDDLYFDLVLKYFEHGLLLFALFAAIPIHPSSCPPASLTTLFTPNQKHIVSH